MLQLEVCFLAWCEGSGTLFLCWATAASSSTCGRGQTRVPSLGVSCLARTLMHARKRHTEGHGGVLRVRTGTAWSSVVVGLVIAGFSSRSSSSAAILARTGPVGFVVGMISLGWLGVVGLSCVRHDRLVDRRHRLSLSTGGCNSCTSVTGHNDTFYKRRNAEDIGFLGSGKPKITV